MTTSTETLVAALQFLAEEMYSEDGVANATVLEAAERLTMFANMAARHVEESKADADEMILAAQRMDSAVVAIKALKDRIRQLEEAGDAMEKRLHLRKNISDQFVYKGDAESVENWNKAKEDKL